MSNAEKGFTLLFSREPFPDYQVDFEARRRLPGSSAWAWEREGLMDPVTHGLTGWLIATGLQADARTRTFAAVAAIAPDVDWAPILWGGDVVLRQNAQPVTAVLQPVKVRSRCPPPGAV